MFVLIAVAIGGCRSARPVLSDPLLHQAIEIYDTNWVNEGMAPESPQGARRDITVFSRMHWYDQRFVDRLAALLDTVGRTDGSATRAQIELLRDLGQMQADALRPILEHQPLRGSADWVKWSRRHVTITIALQSQVELFKVLLGRPDHGYNAEIRVRTKAK